MADTIYSWTLSSAPPELHGAWLLVAGSHADAALPIPRVERITLLIDAHEIGGVADHLHILLGLKSTHCLSDVMRDIKRQSALWIHGTVGRCICATL